MQEALSTIEKASMKKKIADIRVGDTVRVHQRIKEGKKERVQVFEGLVIRYRKQKGISAFLTVRKVASGVGVEKSWFVNSPNVVKIQIMKRSKVRQAVLGYMRGRFGKSARMIDRDFDRNAANEADDRTALQVSKDEQEKIAKEEEKLDGDSAAKNDELNLVDESTEEIAKKEEKQASKDDASSSDGSTTKDATLDDKVNESGNDESQLPAEETQEGLERNK
jgi:large subunit ribosomal protein L19